MGGEVEVLLEETAAELTEVQVQPHCTCIHTAILGSLKGRERESQSRTLPPPSARSTW